MKGKRGGDRSTHPSHGVDNILEAIADRQDEVRGALKAIAAINDNLQGRGVDILGKAFLEELEGNSDHPTHHGHDKHAAETHGVLLLQAVHTEFGDKIRGHRQVLVPNGVFQQVQQLWFKKKMKRGRERERIWGE